MKPFIKPSQRITARATADAVKSGVEAAYAALQAAEVIKRPQSDDCHFFNEDGSLFASSNRADPLIKKVQDAVHAGKTVVQVLEESVIADQVLASAEYASPPVPPTTESSVTSESKPEKKKLSARQNFNVTNALCNLATASSSKSALKAARKALTKELLALNRKSVDGLE